LQGVSPFLTELLRNPRPWHREQASFATAIVSERFQSNFTNVSPGNGLNTQDVPELNFSRFTHIVRNLLRP
jgi:hypothetical protein